MDNSTESKEHSPTEQIISNIPFKFTGKGAEFFKIWVVNIFLSIITLGIYSAWAKVRTNQYFYANTLLDGSSFQYLAKPINILKGRIVAFALLILYSVVQNIFPQYLPYTFVLLMLSIPALIVLSMSFRLKNSAYRKVSFHFHRNFKQAYIIFAVPVLLVILAVVPQLIHEQSEAVQNAAIYNEMIVDAYEDDELTMDEESELKAFALDHGLTLDKDGVAEAPTVSFWIFLPMLIVFLLYPLWEQVFTGFKINSSRFGQSKFSFSAGIWDYYKMYLLGLGVTIGVVVFVLVLVAGIKSLLDTQDLFKSIGLMSVAIGGLALPAFLLLQAYVAVYKQNLMLNNTSLDHVKLISTMEPLALWWIYLSNTLAIVLSLGLAIPWTHVRTARYKAEQTRIVCRSLDSFVALQEKERNALGEEIGEAFDVDIGF